MTVLRTDRLLLRELTPADDAFILRLMNDEAWLANIGDRGIRTLEDARGYLDEGPWTQYRALGFGFYAVEMDEARIPVGVCGLARRAHLDAPDIGFAFLPEHRGGGYAGEAAAAVLGFAASLGLPRVVATVRPANAASRRVLARLGMSEESSFISPSSGEPVLLYGIRLEVGR
ncbi:GNAT family N-acetyltransferase [Roseateles sp. L2-2]|uniref:GNAT family N-acetyltransferase n=1 Tax=Roseateles sp. L2-2 TaxID=3422597 RepID=UPI003D3612EF